MCNVFLEYATLLQVKLVPGLTMDDVMEIADPFQQSSTNHKFVLIF